MDTDVVFAIIVLTAIVVVFFVIGLVAGNSIYSPDSNDKNQIVCTQYLKGTWHGNVCIKNGRVVSTVGP